MGVALFCNHESPAYHSVVKAGWFKMMAMIILLPFIMATSDAIKLLTWKLRCQSMYAPHWKSRQMYDSDMTFLRVFKP